MLVLLTLCDYHRTVFTFLLCIHRFATRMPLIFVLSIKMAKGLLSIWLTLSPTFRVYFFYPMFPSAWPQTFKVELLKLKPLQKVQHSFPVLFLQSSTDAFIQMLILCTFAMPYCPGMWSTSWVQLYFDNMIGTLLCFCQGHVEWGASHKSWEKQAIQSKTQNLAKMCHFSLTFIYTCLHIVCWCE